MNKDDLKIGIIKESKLVDLFGTDAQKKNFFEKGKIIGKYKIALFKQVNKYCDIQKINKRNSKENLYKITKVYNEPLPMNYDKMQKSLYKYTIPLILNTLLCNQCDSNHAIGISINQWSKKIGMINHNYNRLKYNVKCKKSNNDIGRKIPIDVINEFYNKTDNMISHYLTNSLDYLKTAEIITWKEVYKVVIEEPDEISTIDDNKNVVININLHTRSATKEDTDFLFQCIAIADQKVQIKNPSERYYSKKAQQFQTILEKELYRKRIKRIYYTYEAAYTDSNKCNELLSHFDNANSSQIIKEFNKTFSDMIVKNAGDRFDKDPTKYLKVAKSQTEYQSYFETLCETTVDYSAKCLGKKNREQDNDDDYNLIITHTRSYDNESK